MKIRRYKKAHRILSFYQSNFDFKPPYTVLLDATFCNAALEGKVLIKEQIPKYLQGQTKIVTTQCIIMEVEKLSKISPALYGVWLVVKQFPVHKCGHEGNPVPASHCVKSLIKTSNEAKYIVASQDSDLRQHIHEKVIGTPLLYLHSSAPTLEKPGENSIVAAGSSTRTMSEHEASTLASLKCKYLDQTPAEPPRKKKRAKNPHSLSCKKSKKVKNPPQPPREDGKRKRKRHRKKNATLHVSPTAE